MEQKRTTPEFITSLEPNEIFVFGSNLKGMHGGGAAYIAYRKFGAIMGQGVGLQGQSYAIPTMQEELEANGSPRATIETDEERTYFLIDIPCHPYFAKKEIEIDTNGVKEDAESGVKGGVKGGVKELSDIQEIIVKEMLFDPSITTSEMAQKTGIKFRTLQRHISQLQAMGIVVRKDGRKDGYWEVVKNK